MAMHRTIQKSFGLKKWLWLIVLFFAAAGSETRPWTMGHGTKVVSGSQWALVSEVASVSTFAGCLDILDCCRPVWALFENVEAIDREVDQNPHLVIHWFGLYRKEQTKFLILQQMKQQHQCNISNKKCQWYWIHDLVINDQYQRICINRKRTYRQPTISVESHIISISHITYHIPSNRIMVDSCIWGRRILRSAWSWYRKGDTHVKLIYLTRAGMGWHNHVVGSI
jgi:hypothetical protein